MKSARKKQFAIPIETMLKEDEKLNFSRRAFNRAMVEPTPAPGAKVDEAALLLLPTNLDFLLDEWIEVRKGTQAPGRPCR